MNNVYLSTKIPHTGYVYIWYDIKLKFFYIGGHHGKVNDSYVCSNAPMLKAYKIRPHTFKFRVLEFVNGDVKILRAAEQKWLDKIQPHELLNSTNVKNKTCRYYNVKKMSVGGSHKGHVKNRVKPAWNKGYSRTEVQLRSQGLLCFITDKPKPKNSKPTAVLEYVWTALAEQVEKERNQSKFVCEIILSCSACEKEFPHTKKTRKTCSLECSNKMAHRFTKGVVAWNKGKINPTASENGKKGAGKQSTKAKGRKMVTDSNGKRHWSYNNGEIG